MYISRVQIDIDNRRKIKELTHVGAFHHWVEECFPEEIANHIRSRKLWRVDQLQGKSYLLVVSSGLPDVKALEKYGVEGSAQIKVYDQFLNSLEESHRMRFRVVLNPVIALSQGSGHKSLVKPHVTAEYQGKYLLDRSEKNGFSLKKDEFSIVERGYVFFRKSGGRPLRFIKVVYEGVLTISDINLFRKMLIAGLGKHKAYGFGMMIVIPLSY